MIAALILLMLSAFGLTPTDDELAAYENAYYSTVHHIFIELGSEVDEDGFAPTFAIGYEALLDRGGEGSSFEVVAESIGVPFTNEADYFIGVGAGHYFLPKLRISLSAGPVIRPDQNVQVRGRVDVAARFLIFSIAVQPYIRLAATSDDTFDFNFGGRFEY